MVKEKMYLLELHSLIYGNMCVGYFDTIEEIEITLNKLFDEDDIEFDPINSFDDNMNFKPKKDEWFRKNGIFAEGLYNCIMIREKE